MRRCPYISILDHKIILIYIDKTIQRWQDLTVSRELYIGGGIYIWIIASSGLVGFCNDI